MFSYRKVGGLHFLRIGQFGCSFYVSRKHEAVTETSQFWNATYLALFIGTVLAITNL